MRESRQSGSVRGAVGNGRPYRDSAPLSISEAEGYRDFVRRAFLDDTKGTSRIRTHKAEEPAAESQLAAA